MKRTIKTLQAIAICALIPLAGAFSFDFKDFLSTTEKIEKIGKSVNDTSDSLSAIQKATETITPADAYEIGRTVSASILKKYELLNAPKATAYLNKICKSLALNSDTPVIYKDYCVAILKSDEINAISSCGGHIFVTQGLLKCCDSEDAVAAVIAHEMAHIQLEHAVAAIKADRTKNAIGSTVSTASGFVDAFSGMSEKDKLLFDFLAGSNVAVMNRLFETGYPKEQEYKADELALRLLLNSGYDPNAMLELIDKHHKENADNTGWEKTHPKPADRIKKAKAFIAKNKPRGKDKSVRLARFSDNINGKI